MDAYKQIFINIGTGSNYNHFNIYLKCVGLNLNSLITLMFKDDTEALGN